MSEQKFRDKNLQICKVNEYGYYDSLSLLSFFISMNGLIKSNFIDTEAIGVTLFCQYDIDSVRIVVKNNMKIVGKLRAVFRKISECLKLF